MDFVSLSQTRYTTKHYDSSRKISEADFSRLLECLRLAPSSVNSQPWHFFTASTEAAKERILPAVLDFNRNRVADASHIVIFAVRKELSDDYLTRLMQQEIADGRFTKEEAIAGADAGRRHFVGLHQTTLGDAIHWQTHQCYIAMGTLLYAAASMGIDATPIEGLQMDVMDQILDLDAKGLHCVFCISLGYKDPHDSNFTRPKSRWSTQEVITSID